MCVLTIQYSGAKTAVRADEKQAFDIIIIIIIITKFV